MEGKILVLLVSMALLVGFLSGCIEEKTEEEPIVEANNAPVAKFTSSVEHNVTMAGGDATFNASGSSDEDEGTILTYAWDFDNDGVVDSTDMVVTWTYAANGTYPVTLTVNDGTDDSDPVSEDVVVGNVAPVAGFSYAEGPNYNETYFEYVFTDTSTDANVGDTLTYLWDINDGTEQNTTAGPITYVFANAGSYNVTLTVTDGYGLTDTDTQVVNIIVS